MFLLVITLLLMGLVGHVVLWASLVNRVHGGAMRRRWIDLATFLYGLAIAAIPLVAGGIFWHVQHDYVAKAWRVTAAVAWCYVVFCAVYLVLSASQRWWHGRHAERRGVVLTNHTTHLDLRSLAAAPLSEPGLGTWLCRLPGNQSLQVQFHEEQLRIGRLPPAGDGLRIAHLSDLHMSGRIAKRFFGEVIDHVNELRPDLIAVTGDLVENETCVDWIPDTLGRLRAPGGVYFVLGNHDRRVDQQRLHSVLAQTDMVHLGGSWLQVTVRELPLLLAGNELPWYSPAADLAECPPRDEAGLPLRILLAHGPDQFAWAQQHDVDLMLAGHNHGGQVRLPLLGPILAPSLSGVRYASGVFHAGPTVMHVSRGTSSKTPIRWNCPPEASLLVLRPGT
jgi:uncharacterized protein